MARVELDLRRLGPAEAPRADRLAAVTGADSVLVRGAVPALAGVLGRLLKDGRTADVPVAWEPCDDRDSVGLARELGLGSGAQRELSLVRDGVPLGRPVHRWTWYADDRVRWRLDP